MKDNPIKKLSALARSAADHAGKKIKWELGRLSPRQRLWIVLALFALFVAVDVIYIVNGFKGDTKAQIEVEHLQQLNLQPENGIENDSIQ